MMTLWVMVHQVMIYWGFTPGNDTLHDGTPGGDTLGDGTPGGDTLGDGTLGDDTLGWCTWL